MVKLKKVPKRVITKVAVPLCMWFAMCTNPATNTTKHPILGDVPTCDRCHKFATDK